MALLAILAAGPGAAAAATAPAGDPGQRRPHGVRVRVPPATIRLMDGDTAEIRWSAADVETVRILGIDAPELVLRDGRAAGRRPAGSRRAGLSPRGAEARGFARGAFAQASRVDLLRASRLDRFRRTLGYLFLDGRNYSVLAIRAGYARETVTRYGDNGLPREAAEVLSAARAASGGSKAADRPGGRRRAR